MEKKFYLSSGLEVIQDEFILHTPDYGFTAGIRKNWSSDFDGYTSFRFRNEILDNVPEAQLLIDSLEKSTRGIVR